MKRPQAIVGLLLVGLWCAGCTNISLGTAQRDLDDLLDRRAAGFDDSDGWRSAAETSPEFLDLAARAQAAAGEAGLDPRTKVSFYRIAAAAAWKAGEPGSKTFGEVTDDGGSECRALMKGGSAPPRDCAFLLVVPAFQWHDLKIEQIDEWSVARSNDPSKLAREAVQIRTLAGKYYPNTLGYLVARAGEVAKIPGLDPSFCGYLESQAKIFKTHVLLLQEIAVKASREAPDDTELEEFVAGDKAQTVQALSDLRDQRYQPESCRNR